MARRSRSKNVKETQTDNPTENETMTNVENTELPEGVEVVEEQNEAPADTPKERDVTQLMRSLRSHINTYNKIDDDTSEAREAVGELKKEMRAMAMEEIEETAERDFIVVSMEYRNAQRKIDKVDERKAKYMKKIREKHEALLVAINEILPADFAE